MLLSKTCCYAIRATVFLAMQPPDRFIPVRAISEELGISFHFLTKILHELTAKGILSSFRGPNGGVKLTKNANAIPVMDIVLAIDRGDVFTECVLGLEGCGDRQPCPIHDHWCIVRESIKRVFESVTLGGVASQIEREGARLDDILLQEPAPASAEKEPPE
jgi:Rrf2 family protein